MNLNEDVLELKKKYREVFLKTLQKLQKTDSVEEVFENVCLKKAEIKHSRKNFQCCGCGSCCKLAISEFSPKELKNKAKFGDNYAKQFIETFIPYENIEDARKIFPEYIDMLEETQQADVYFYHCPKVTEDNRCPDYENRPQICRDFPDNPIGFLPPLCAFNKWKEKSLENALEIKATTELLEYYKTQS